MIRLDGATVLLQWSTGLLAFLWVTTRRREVGIGYGWLVRGVGLGLSLGAVATAALVRADTVRDVAAALMTVAIAAVLAASVARRRGGLHHLPAALDLVAPAIGVVGLVAAGLDAGGPHILSVVRTLVGAAFLGVVSDAMLLGHWYLVQPGLSRAPLNELTRLVAVVWPVEVGALLWPPGMVRVLTGRIDDGWHGTLGWFWVACALTTIVLAFVTRAALRERAYSAVMAATGLLYLAILTAFGTDLVARAVLSG